MLLSTTNHQSTREQCQHFLKDPSVGHMGWKLLRGDWHVQSLTDSTKISFVAHNNYVALNTEEFCIRLYIPSQRETDLGTVSEVYMIMSSMQTE